jgi:hypothetical protein
MTRQQRQEDAPLSQTPVAQSSFPAPLSPHWAFVVQLRQGTTLTAAAIHGRVEHVVSGRQAYFNSLDELRVFMERVLTELGENPP